jgi:hypothetical protein
MNLIFSLVARFREKLFLQTLIIFMAYCISWQGPEPKLCIKVNHPHVPRLTNSRLASAHLQ